MSPVARLNPPWELGQEQIHCRKKKTTQFFAYSIYESVYWSQYVWYHSTGHVHCAAPGPVLLTWLSYQSELCKSFLLPTAWTSIEMCPYKAIAESRSSPAHKEDKPVSSSVVLLEPWHKVQWEERKELKRWERCPNTSASHRGHHASVIT